MITIKNQDYVGADYAALNVESDEISISGGPAVRGICVDVIDDCGAVSRPVRITAPTVRALVDKLSAWLHQQENALQSSLTGEL